MKPRARKLLRLALALTLAAAALAACDLIPTPVLLPPDSPTIAAPTETLPPSSTPTEEPTAMLTPTAESFIQQGDQAAQGGDYQQAITFYTQAIQLDPSNALAYYKRGLAYAQSEDQPAAILDYNQALALNPQYAPAYSARAAAYLELDGLALALDDVARGITVDATYAPLYQLRALIQIEAGNPQLAITDLEVYLALAPDAPDRAEMEVLLAALQSGEPTPTPDLAQLVLSEDFSDPATGAFQAYEQNAQYLDGSYVLTLSTPGSFYISPLQVDYSDVRVEFNARKVGGDDNNFLGVLCRFVDLNNYYAFLISSDGYYGIGKRVLGGELQLIGADVLQPSEFIQQGDGTNHIVAECVGNTLRLTVNGVLLAEVQDDEFTSGDISLAIGTYDVPSTSIAFDDFKLYTVVQ